MPKEDIEIKMSVMKVIYRAMMPIYYRLNSLLEDLVHKRVMLCEVDRSILLEYCSCAGALKVLFENYFELYPDSKEGDKIVLPYDEYMTIMSLSKTVELSTRTPMGMLTLREH